MLGEIAYPTYRLVITTVAIVIGLAIWYLIARTRTGGLIRASADNRAVVQALGANVDTLGAGVFALVASARRHCRHHDRAADRGDIRHGRCRADPVAGGGDHRRARLDPVGALVGALLVAFVEVFGRTYLPLAFGNTTGFALANMSIYLLMAMTLVWRPFGIFGKAAMTDIAAFDSASRSVLASWPCDRSACRLRRSDHAALRKPYRDHGTRRGRGRCRARLCRARQLGSCGVLRAGRLCTGRTRLAGL